MSIEVAVEDLAAEVERRGAGYLLTSTAGSRPHVMHVRFTIDGTELRADIGRSASANIGAQKEVTLLWPPEPGSEHSLIVDGEATVEGSEDGPVAVVTATSAVLHVLR